MAAAKPKPLDSGVEAYLAKLSDATRQEDCRTLIDLMRRATR